MCACGWCVWAVKELLRGWCQHSACLMLPNQVCAAQSLLHREVWATVHACQSHITAHHCREQHKHTHMHTYTFTTPHTHITNCTVKMPPNWHRVAVYMQTMSHSTVSVELLDKTGSSRRCILRSNFCFNSWRALIWPVSFKGRIAYVGQKMTSCELLKVDRHQTAAEQSLTSLPTVRQPRPWQHRSNVFVTLSF